MRLAVAIVCEALAELTIWEIVEGLLGIAVLGVFCWLMLGFGWVFSPELWK